MAQTIKIKRSTSTSAPSSLAAGELAYSDASDKLFIGQPSDNSVTAIGGKVYVAPKAAKQFISFFDRNEDKQEAMLKALQSASTTAKLFDVLGLKYKLDMER